MILVLWYPTGKRAIEIPDGESRQDVERTVAMFGAVAYEIALEPQEVGK